MEFRGLLASATRLEAITSRMEAMGIELEGYQMCLVVLGAAQKVGILTAFDFLDSGWCT